MITNLISLQKYNFYKYTPNFSAIFLFFLQIMHL